MKAALCEIDLGNDQANYTIGQLVTHLKRVVDYSDYEKVVKHLMRREERVKEEARKEMEEVVVRRYEGKYEEVVKWKVKVEESIVKFEDDVKLLRERYNELKKQKGVVDEGVSVSGLMASKGNVELGKGKLSLGEVKVEVEGFQNVWKEKSDLLVENARLQKEVRECREMYVALKNRADVEKLEIMEIEQLKMKLKIMEMEHLKKKAERDLEVEKLRSVEMESLKKKAEKDLEMMENHVKSLTEESHKLRRDDKAWREMHKNLREREEDAMVRAWELEIQLESEASLRVAAEKSMEAVECQLQDLTDANLKLRKEIEDLREMNEVLKKWEVEAKVTVSKLETELEIEGSLRIAAEEELETLERKVKELEMKISVKEKDTNMLLTCPAELDCCRKGKVAGSTSPMEAGGSSKGVNLVDLDDSQARNSMEACNCLVLRKEVGKVLDIKVWVEERLRKECEDLRKENLRLKGVVEDVMKDEKDKVKELKLKVELEVGLRKKAEEELEVWMNKFNELDSKVLSLTKDVDLLRSSEAGAQVSQMEVDEDVQATVRSLRNQFAEGTSSANPVSSAKHGLGNCIEISSSSDDDPCEVQLGSKDKSDLAPVKLDFENDYGSPEVSSGLKRKHISSIHEDRTESTLPTSTGERTLPKFPKQGPSIQPSSVTLTPPPGFGITKPVSSSQAEGTSRISKVSLDDEEYKKSLLGKLKQHWDDVSSDSSSDQ